MQRSKRERSIPATSVVIRYEGPRGGPGMREMLAVTAAIKGIPELSESLWHSLTDGRFSGATRGLMAGHVAPKRYLGGPIAAVHEGDTITFDIPNRKLPAQHCRRRDRQSALLHGRRPEPRYKRGVFAKYAEFRKQRQRRSNHYLIRGDSSPLLLHL